MQPSARGTDIELHVITGKGGTGKTTVAASLALAHAQQGRQVLLVEVEGRDALGPVIDSAPFGPSEDVVLTTPAGGTISGLAVNPRDAFEDYLRTLGPLGRAGPLLERVGAVDFATSIAPGLGDVLVIGRIYDALRRPQRRAKGAAARGALYDVVVMDAPPTGRIGRFLGVNSQLADLARVGPVRAQADAVSAMIRRPATQVHVVSQLEEMPVQETLDAIGELTGLGLPVGQVIVNAVPPPRLDPQAGERVRAMTDTGLRATLARTLPEASVDPIPSVVTALVGRLRQHQVEQDRDDAQRRRLLGSGQPLVDLPEVDAQDGRDLVEHLASVLTKSMPASPAPAAAR